MSRTASPPGASRSVSRRFVAAMVLATCASAAPSALAAGQYPWQTPAQPPASQATLAERFAPPSGFERLPAAQGSFADWLRGLPMHPEGAPVRLYTGSNKPRQDQHAGVIDVDTGPRDLQQCADAVMRLRAEWLYAVGRSKEIAFNVSQGGRIPFSRWAEGARPSASGKSWTKKAPRDETYANLRRYLDFIFAYAGTASLEKELLPVADPHDVAPGDVFIQGGFPGHAVLVADVAQHATTKARRFLLIQSFMPAQEMHVLRNPANPDGTPWYGVPYEALTTPDWTFAAGSLRRWP